MRADELREAIEQPAYLVGCEPEPSLTERLLADVKGQPGALPLLQFALKELWEKRDVRNLRLDTYEAVGGIAGALEHRADEIFRNFKREEQDLCCRIFLRLVQPGEGTGDTKRRVAYPELLPDDPARAEAARRIIQRLADPEARLITMAGREESPREKDGRDRASYVEVAHEALIRDWPQLRRWIDADRAGLRLHRQLTEAAREWKEHVGDASFLFQGTRLTVAREWAEAHSQELNFEERAFLEASVQQEQKRQADEVAAAHRLAEEAEARRQAEADHAKRLRRLAWFLLVISIAATVFAVIAAFERYKATTQAVIANRQAAKLALERGTSLCEQGDVGRGMLWMARSLELIPGEEEDDQLQWAIRVKLANWGRSLASLDQVLSHEDWVNAVQFSPDGKLVLTGSGRYYGEGHHAAQLWDPATGRPAGELLWRPPYAVMGVAFSPDGATLAAGSFDGTTQLWDAATRHPKGPPLTQDASFGHYLSFSPDGRSVLTAGRRFARLWDAATGTPRGQPMPLEDAFAVAFSPDGKIALTGGKDRLVRFWNGSTGQFLGTEIRPQPPSWIYALAFNPDGKTILVGEQRAAQIWHTDGRPDGEPFEHTEWVKGVAFSPDGGLMATGCSDGYARVWSVEERKPIGQPMAHGGEVISIAFGPDGRSLLTGSEDTTARIWKLPLGRVATRWIPHPQAVAAAAFSPDGKSVLTGSRDHAARRWNAATGVLLGAELQHDGPVVKAVFRPDGRAFLTVCGDTVWLWDTATGARLPGVAPMQHPALGQLPAILDVTFSPDGRTIVTAGSDSCLKRWDAGSGKPLGDLIRDVDAIHTLAFSPDGRTIVTGNWRGQVQHWDALDGRRIGPVCRHGSNVLDAAYHPKGRLFLTGSEDGTAQLWDARDSRPVGPLLYHRRPVTGVAFSPDGQAAATASEDGTARLWDVVTGTPLGPPINHPEPVNDVAFSADGRTLLTACDDGQVRLWDLFTPLDGTPRRIVKWAQVTTGLELGVDDAIRPLEAADWESQRNWLRQMGGDPIELGETPAGLENWHREQAAKAVGAGRPFARRWHLDRLRGSVP